MSAGVRAGTLAQRNMTDLMQKKFSFVVLRGVRSCKGPGLTACVRNWF